MKFEYSQADFIINGIQWDTPRTAWLSEFDHLLMSRWDAIMKAGHFRYTLEDFTYRTVPGDQKLVLQLNTKRASMRRQPEHIETLNMPFNRDKFNFTKVKSEEIMFELVPEADEDCDEDDDMDHVLINGEELRNCKQNSGCSTEVRRDSGIDHRGSKCKTPKHFNNISQPKKCERGRHLMLVNVSPLEYGHTLVIPNVHDGIHQKLTRRAIKMAIEMVLLSGHPGIRVGFNSLCAFASVNHQHMHTWYFEQKLPIETADVLPVCDEMYEMVGMPTKALVFQLHGNTLDQLARMVFTATNYFQQKEIAHNVFLTRGSQFGQQGLCQDTFRTVRVYIWPRKNITGLSVHFLYGTNLTPQCVVLNGKNEQGHNKLDKLVLRELNVKDEVKLTGGIKNENKESVFNVAVAELAGQIPVYDAERYKDLTEEEIITKIQDHLLPDAEFERLKLEVAAMLTKA